MAQTILYYPTINIQDGTWLRNAILYWDEVSSIVPYENYPDFSPELLYLQELGVYKAVYPRELFFSEFAEDFCNSILKRIKELGIRILMDDFGIGYSNIMNIRKSPIDVIKIDKSFIDDIVIDAKTRSIVQFLIQLCKVNGMESIAEGVNDAKQVAILRKLQCDTIQGYYYSKPLNRNDFEKLLLQNDFEKKGATEK